MPRTIHVVTHPEATHVVDGLIGGWHDSALTPTGIAAAELIGDAVRALAPQTGPVELYSSDLRRTRMTADAIAARLGVAPKLDPDLREQSYGEAEGGPVGSDPRYTPIPATGDRMRHHDGVPGSETRRDVGLRVYAAMDRIVARHCPCQVIVTHGGALTYVVAAWIGMPLESAGYVSFRVAPGSITTLVEDDVRHDRQVTRLGDTAHLTGLLQR